MSEIPGGSEPEHRSTEDEAWASIVENFGERAQLTEADVTPPPTFLIPIEPEPEPEAPALIASSDEHYVPPAVPRVGLADGPRGAAWLGLLGAPVLFLLALFTGIAIPQWLSLFAVVAFLASIGYLFATMRGDDDEPWDDGARV